ncbi:MAG: type II secretion system minor pseudopilin GspI [Phenylobacterium sp.]|uniref:type II secretion system minor pseudopilin GspI n=1 Tax=Phenylobacterium sp. TaxID=1871053 RepID=UPI00391C1855
MCASRAEAPRRRRAEEGFSLIEVMVALAVFGLAVLALLNLAGENTRTVSAAETRVLARVVADNQAIEALTSPLPPAVGAVRGEEQAGGRRWRWTRQVSRTGDPQILQVAVRVADPSGRRTAAEVVVFRGPGR